MKSKVKEIYTPYKFQGRTYQLKATFNVEAEIYEQFGGSFAEALQGFSGLKNALVILAILINEAVDIHNETVTDDFDRWEHLDPKFIGRHINEEEGGFPAAMDIVTKTLTNSRPEVNEDELTDEEKNA